MNKTFYSIFFLLSSVSSFNENNLESRSQIIQKEEHSVFKKKWNQLITVITDEENKITTTSLLAGIISYPFFKKITLMQALTKRFPQSIKFLSGRPFWLSLLTAGIGGLATALVIQPKILIFKRSLLI